MSISNLIASAVDAPAFFNKDTKKGASVTLEVTATDLRQTRDPKNNKPQTWDDGSPMQQIVIVGNNTDTGKPNTVYVKWWGDSRKKFAAAILESGSDEPERGGLLTVTYEGEGEKPSNPTLSAPKLYSYAYAAPGEWSNGSSSDTAPE